jgi:hypothetical protein
VYNETINRILPLAVCRPAPSVHRLFFCRRFVLIWRRRKSVNWASSSVHCHFFLSSSRSCICLLIISSRFYFTNRRYTMRIMSTIKHRRYRIPCQSKSYQWSYWVDIQVQEFERDHSIFYYVRLECWRMRVCQHNWLVSCDIQTITAFS